MSIARHHAEWLSLVPVSGPFLSLPVLMEAFNTGLEPHDPEQSRLLRQEYANWLESFEKRRADPAPHQHWIKFIITKTLELDDRVLAEGQKIPQALQVEVPEHHELLRPNIVLIDPTTKSPRLLVQTYSRSQVLGSYVANSPWKASPDTRMTELLHGTGVRLGLVTNGEHWMLVDAPKGGTTGFASWYGSLWLEEPITLRAFRSLLSASRFFNVPDDQTLEALLIKSASNQQEVTDQLGYQVRQAVEVLIHEIAKIEHEPEIDADLRKLIAEVPEAVLYESALTVMMRLVILFCAEERGLIPTKPFPVYEQNYAVSTISKQLRELADQHDEALLERRYDAWPRLLAAFRAVYGGLQHDDVHIPAYGGSLFNPDRFPFLEGRKRGSSWRDSEAHPIPVSNRTVLHLLEALQLLRMKVPGGGPTEARRISFRALDIEQIGHVYEGLLDHTAKRASEPFLGLAGTREKEPEIPLAELEKLLAKGEADLVTFLNEETGKSENALKKALKVEIDPQDAARFRTVCQGDDSLLKRVMPLAGFVRLDDNGYPVVIPKGHVFVTAGTDRRSSGTHYTPPELTKPIVENTLEPLVYVGPAEGKPKNEWKLKSAKELLDLKICDMACGSGAFLVQADRYMAERLLEAWEAPKQANLTTPGITPEGTPSTGKANETLIPDDPIERKTYAMRIIAQRCLYGVDKNPLAAEMAKLSLWLLTLAKDKPFEFLDHAIRCGDSLVGIHSIEQLQHFSIDPEGPKSVRYKGVIKDEVVEAIKDRLKIEEMPVVTVEDVERQEELLKQSEARLKPLRLAADLLVSASFWRTTPRDREEWTRHFAVVANELVDKKDVETLEKTVAKERQSQPMFHWPLEFPEVAVKKGGFDAFVGNPPFRSGSRISSDSSSAYLAFIKLAFPTSLGNTDLVCYFLLRSWDLARKDTSCLGFITTNSISQGDNRSSTLLPLMAQFRLHFAFPNMLWPGSASLFVSLVGLARAEFFAGHCNLNGRTVTGINANLEETQTEGEPFSLAENADLGFKGVEFLGDGFKLAPEVGKALYDKYKSAGIVRPWLNGADITESVVLPQRFAIDFADMSKESASKFADCFEIVQRTVKPVRENDNRAARRERWWQFGEKAMGMRRSLEGYKSAFVRPFTSDTYFFETVPTHFLFTNALIVVVSSDYALFAVLSSCIHEAWSRNYGSSLKMDFRYTPSKCLETFPFPTHLRDRRLLGMSQLELVGQQYQESRWKLAKVLQEGITPIYNRFHDPDESSADIQMLRGLHVEMDQAVVAAYGWTNLKLDHGFHEAKQGVRFTISEPARREVLQRLLKLNHERHAEEEQQGVPRKKEAAKKKVPKEKGASKLAKKGGTLFHGEEDE